MSACFRLIACFLSIGLLATMYQDARAEAEEPQVAFALKNGWIELALRHQGRPVADAVIEVIDEAGKNFGEGQTDAAGQSAFPLPPGKAFTVEIKTGSRLADPIRLLNVDAHIVPERVLLSYGLRPCCRFKDRSSPVPTISEAEAPAAPSETPTDWRFRVAFTGAALLALAAVFVVGRRCAGLTNLPTRK